MKKNLLTVLKPIGKKGNYEVIRKNPIGKITKELKIPINKSKEIEVKMNGKTNKI
jgi:hypothetical protein